MGGSASQTRTSYKGNLHGVERATYNLLTSSKEQKHLTLAPIKQRSQNKPKDRGFSQTAAKSPRIITKLSQINQDLPPHAMAI